MNRSIYVNLNLEELRNIRELLVKNSNEINESIADKIDFAISNIHHNTLIKNEDIECIYMYENKCKLGHRITCENCNQYAIPLNVKQATISLKNVLKTLEKPRTCGECEFYQEKEYRCHNDVGKEATCQKGYMIGKDMRDKSYRYHLYEECKLEK